MLTQKLKKAIEDLLEKTPEGSDESIDKVRKMFQDHTESATDTQSRIQFLYEKLESGMSKRDAARALCDHDSRVSPGTAETLVYTVFSGQFQKNSSYRRDMHSKPDLKSSSSGPSGYLQADDDESLV